MKFKLIPLAITMNRNTILGIAAAIAAGFAIYSFVEKKPQKKKEAANRKPPQKKKNPDDTKSNHKKDKKDKKKRGPAPKKTA